MSKQLISIGAYAKLKGVTRECVRKWVLKGKVKTKVVGAVPGVDKGKTYIVEEINHKEK